MQDLGSSLTGQARNAPADNLMVKHAQTQDTCSALLYNISLHALYICNLTRIKKVLNYFTLQYPCIKVYSIIIYYSIVPKNLKIKIYKTIILPVVLYGCET